MQPEQQPVIIPIQGQQIVYGADNQQYVLVQQQNPPQNGLINASYACSGIGLLIFGIILGPIGYHIWWSEKLTTLMLNLGTWIYFLLPLLILPD